MADCPPGYYECPCGSCGPPCDQCYNQLGCSDPSANNYQDGCVPEEGYPCLDCTDAGNITPDHSCCTYPQEGCTDPAATNYDGAEPGWTPCLGGDVYNSCCEYECQDDSDCGDFEFCKTNVYPYECQTGGDYVGCTDPTAWNYDAAALVDLNDSCNYSSNMNSNSGGDSNIYYNVRAGEQYDGLTYLQNRAHIKMSAHKWDTPIQPVYTIAELSDGEGYVWTMDEDTDITLPISLQLDGLGYDYNSDFNSNPTLVWEFDSEPVFVEDRALYAGSVGNFYPLTQNQCVGDFYTNNSYNLDTPSINSVDCFKFEPNPNWNGDVGAIGRCRVLSGEMLLQYNTGVGAIEQPNSLGTTPGTGLKYNFTNSVNQKFALQVWAQNTIKDNPYIVSFKKDGTEWQGSFDWDYHSNGNIKIEPDHDTREQGLSPYTFHLEDSMLPPGVTWDGDWTISIWSDETDGSYPDKVNNGPLKVAALYIYHHSSGDYISNESKFTFVVRPIPDPFIYEEHPEHPYPAELDVMAGDPRGIVNFDNFAGGVCSNSGFKCNQKIIKQYLTSETPINPPGPPVGTTIPSYDVGTGEGDKLRYEWFQEDNLVPGKPVYITVTSQDAEGGAFIDFNGQLNTLNMREGTNIDYNSTLHSWRVDTQTFEYLPAEGDDSAVLDGLNYVEFYRTWDGASLLRFTIWQEGSCPSENDECNQWGTIRDVDVIPEGDYINLADCVANHLCNEDYTLTQLGMIHYDYYLSYDEEQMSNVLYPNEVIKGVLFQASMGDFNDLQEAWEMNKTKEWVIQGFRDTENKCCLPYGDYPDFDCIESLQTRFKIQELNPIVNNLVDNPTGRFLPNYSEYANPPYMDVYSDSCTTADPEKIYHYYTHEFPEELRKPDLSLHTDAVWPLQLTDHRWQKGRNCFGGMGRWWSGTVAQGYHARWIQNPSECLTEVCVRMPDRNTTYIPHHSYDPDSDMSLGTLPAEWRTEVDGQLAVKGPHRWLGISQKITSNIEELNVKVGDKITVSCYVKIKPNEDTVDLETGYKHQVGMGLHHLEGGAGTFGFSGNNMEVSPDGNDSDRNAVDWKIVSTGWDKWERFEATFQIGSDWDLNNYMTLYTYAADSGHFNGGENIHGTNDWVDVYFDNFQVSLTPFSGYFFQDNFDLPQLEKYYYNHYAMSAYILNSPLTFCEGDKILKEGGFGYGSTAFDLQVSPQPSLLEVPTEIARSIYYNGERYFPGDTIQTPANTTWQYGVNHQNLGFIDGVIVKTNNPGENFVSESYPDKNLLTNDNFNCYTDTLGTADGLDNSLGFSEYLNNNILLYYNKPGAIAFTTKNTSQDTSINAETRFEVKSQYIPTLFDYKGQVTSEHFHFSLLVNDRLGCYDESSYVQPPASHKILDSTGEQIGTSTPFTSQKWMDIGVAGDMESDETNGKINYFFSAADRTYRPLDDENSQWLEMSYFHTIDQRQYMAGNNGIYDYSCEDNYILEDDFSNDDRRHFAGPTQGGACQSEASCQAESDTKCWRRYYWSTTVKPWDDMSCHSQYGGVCRVANTPWELSGFVSGESWVNYNNDGQKNFPIKNEFWNEWYLGAGAVELKQSGFYHAPLPTQLKYYKNDLPTSRIERISPQPLDFPDLFPATEAFPVTMSIAGFTNDFDEIYNKFNGNYPREEETYTQAVLEGLGINDEKVYYSVESEDVQRQKGIQYYVTMSGEPKIKHKYSETYAATAFDGVEETLPFYGNGLPFYVDDLYADTATVISYKLQRPPFIDSTQGSCVEPTQPDICPEGTMWLIDADIAPEGCCYSNTSEVNYSQTFTHSINILEANVPKIQSVIYKENAKRQIGVQQGQLIEYNLVDTDISSGEYLQSSELNGSKAVGSIDFASYDLGDNPVLSTYITVTEAESGELKYISEIFTIEEDQVWNNVVDAINNGFDGVQTHKATLIDNSQNTEGSSQKTVIIESLFVGAQNNGSLNWGVTDTALNNQPTFTPLINGDIFPVVPIYEDFEYFDLELVASDIDSNTKITYQVDTEDEFIISASIHDYTYFSQNLGDTEFDDGGDDIADLVGNEASASARIRFFAYPSTYDTILDNGEVQTLPLVPHFNGRFKFVVRAMDNSTLFDELKVELDIKPVNDPPLMEIIGDNEVYMNNINYPTQISIPVESVDIEEGRNSLDFQGIVEINESYCDKVMQVQDEITNRLTGFDFDGNEVDCTDRFNCRVFCTNNLSDWYYENNIAESTGEPLEHMCDFADFNNDNIINEDDVFDCQNAVVENSVGFQSVELSTTPHWINTLNTYEGQTWEEHLNYAEQFSPDIYHQYWGNLTPKRYVRIIPNYNEAGVGKFRVKATDLGLNEYGVVDEIRTGYATGSVVVKPLSKEGPTGEILAIEYASLGIRPDTYLYTAQGDEVRSEVPAKESLTQDVFVTTFGYHSYTQNSNQGQVHNCGQLSLEVNGINDPGFLNMRGECCSVFPTAGVDGNTTNFLSAFWNKDIKYYYEEDFNDAVNDYINYVSYFMEAPFDASFGNQVCGFNLESSNNYYAYNHGPFNYRGVETDNANQGGYITPNQDLNNADHVVSYRLEIEDIVESYDIATLIQSGSGIDFSSQFEGFEMDDQGNINEPWSDKWNALVQEGWPVDGTTNPNYGRVVFRTPTIDALSKGSRMIEDGFVYRYDYPSVFLVTVFATDSYGFEGKTQTLVDARDLVYIKQTLLNQYSPWQGMNITGIENVQNSLGDIENRDVDDRKSLGLFYYDEINPIDDWTMKYGQAYRGMEGNWVTSYPIDYYYGEPYNKIQFSENFDNQYIRADIEAGFDATNQQIYSEVLKRAFPNHGGLISSATSIVGDIPEEIDEEINTVASQIREELGNSAIAIFNAWALGKIFKEALPLGVQQIVDKIQELMSEPLKVTHTVVKALEEESSVVSSTFDDSGNASEFKTLCIAVNQYESATLDCGEGQSIKRVIFDSYGLPVGECGVYSINPEAHCTPNTVDWINKRTVTVSAENSLCGNTAPDITKYRYVEVQCGYDRYNKWYKGGRFIENADYASTSDGVLAYDKMATAPNKTILETDKEDKAYLVYQKDALSDYYGKYYCNIDYEDDFFNQSSYYKLPNEFKDITTDGQEDLQDIDKDYNIYWLTDSIGECEEMCHWRDYTPENNTCTYTDSWPLNQVKVPVNIRTCSDSYGNNPCGACGADFQIGACLQYDWNGYHNYHYYGHSWGCTQAQCGDYGFRYRCEGSGVDFNGTTQTEAQNFCIDNCYTPKAYNGGAAGDDCVQIDALNASLLKDGNIIKPYQYYLGQNNLVETVDRQRIDRIFSVYMRPYYNEDKNGIGGNTAIPSSHAYEPTKSTIVFRAVADYLPGSDEDINGVYGNVGYGSHIEPVELLNGPFYYGYSNKMDINWNEIYDGTSIWYNPETTLGGSHPEYPDVPMWGIEEINIDPNDSYTDEPNRGLWYKFWVRVLHDENISEYKTEIYPGGLEGEHEASVFLWGTMVQEINPYDEIQMAYQPTRFPGEIGLYDFLPDVDVRTINSADGFKSRLFEYYDDELQPGKYIETTAPLTAQLYFYPRNANDKNLFQPKSIVEYPQQSLYVGFVDWGDGSKPEYDQEPYEVKESNVLKHTYEKSGVYEIKGEIFNIARDTNGIVLGVGRFYTFILRINVNINKEIEGEFQLLGGEKYTFIPYQNTFPVISGTSNKSIYKKIIQRTLGYMDENDPTKKIDVPFKYHGDEMRTELALNTLDDRFVGPTISAYTGSYPSQSGLLDSDTIEIYGGSDACEESASMFVCTSTQEVFDDAYVCGQNCHDYEIAKDGPKGFYEGNVDTITGQLVAEGSTYTDVDGATQTSTIIPKLINKGVDLYGGELGDFLGDIDIAQLRYFEKPVDMWEMLGFPCLNTLESSIINYLPFSIRDNWTHTNMQVLHHSLMMNGYDTFFDSSNKLVTQNNEGSSVEYVVEFPTGIGYEGIKGKSFVFSFFARVWTGYPTIPVNIKMGTYISDEWIMSNQIVDATDEWQRFSIQVDFEDYVDFDPTQLKVEIELTPNTGVETLYVLAPQLQRNELTDYRLPNSPVLSGTCTEAPGGNPGNERYFKNIIPKDKPIYERTGITHISESGWSIDVDDNQQWDEINEYGNNLYYPVLPKLDKLGNTTSILQSNSEGTPNIPFGSIGRNWDTDDMNSPITSETIHHLPLVKDCLIDIDFSSESNQALEDLSGNTNLAIFIGDYRVSFNTLMVPKKASSFRTMILGSREKQKGY